MESRNKFVESSEIQNHILPDDIVENILLALPVKSLFRFRSTSKSWCYLIGSKHFVQTHLEKSGKSPTLALDRIIMMSYDPSKLEICLRHCSLHSLMNDPSTCTYTFHDPFMQTWEVSYCIVSCCHGLICFQSRANEFFLWNPSTRLWNKLPDIKLKGGHVVKCWFWFDERNGDYKVLAVVKFKTQLGNKKEGRMYSLKSNSWSEIRMPQIDGIKKLLHGIFVKGKLHWLRSKYPELELEAVWFDWESEQHGIVQLPRPTEDVMWPSQLVEIDGCLGMLSVDPSIGMEVWIMKEYGVKDSWSKVRTISRDSWPEEVPYWKILHIGETGDLLSACQFKFIIYNLKDCIFRESRDFIFDPYVYMESLVSPFPGLQ